MTDAAKSRTFLRRHVALPADHGSWVFLFMPLLVGLFAGGGWTAAHAYLMVAALAAFLIRQPVTVAVKVFSGRRARRDLPAAWFWTAVYGLLALLALAGLLAKGYTYLLLLALPGVPVFVWHLLLVSRRAERRQLGVEAVGSGVLALGAPAAYWVSLGEMDPLGWFLFALVWLQSAASIIYAYLRLEQRLLQFTPDILTRLSMGSHALAFTTFNLVLVIFFSAIGFLPALLPLPYASQWAETIWGTLRPAIGLRPTAIGLRQLLVSALFTALFVLAWH